MSGRQSELKLPWHFSQNAHKREMLSVWQIRGVTAKMGLDGMVYQSTLG
jgi:hypothetical protein